MSKGRRENFRVQLILDRQQRKLLDRVIDVCNFAMHHAIRHAIQRLETLKLVAPLDDFEAVVSEFVQDVNPPLFDETKKEIAKNACDAYTSVVTDMVQNKRRNRTMMCVVPAKDVLFASSGRIVRVPYLGAVTYRRNMFAVTSEGGIYIPQAAHKMVLGYFLNEPCLVLMTAEPPKPQGTVIGDQKLVKVTASEIAHRRKAKGTGGSPNREPK